MSTETAADRGSATRVVVSYPSDLSNWGQHQIDQRHFRAYLRKTLGDVREGDLVEEFVGVGCCGSALDVPLRIERIEGGDRVGEDTDVVYEERGFCGVEGSWRVQSAGGPRN